MNAPVSEGNVCTCICVHAHTVMHTSSLSCPLCVKGMCVGVGVDVGVYVGV